MRDFQEVLQVQNFFTPILKKIRVFSSQTKKCWPKIMRRLMISLRNFYKQVFLYLVITVLFEKDPLAFINICTCDLKISAASYNRS